MPVMDLTLGFHQVAKFYYFPGWHQQATINELIISKKKWAEFSDTQKAILQAACDATMLQQFAEGEAVQFKAMKEIQAKGVQLKKWPQNFLDAYEKAWVEVAAEQAAKSPEFKKAWDSYSSLSQGLRDLEGHGLSEVTRLRTGLPRRRPGARMQALLKIADAIEAVLRRIADAGAWAFIACIAVITLDVVTRKFGFQFPGMGSTRLQELEWHLHAVLFCTWLGYAYVRNAHVRIDVFIGGLSPRGKLWLELWGCVLFALPYLWVALPYALDFFLRLVSPGRRVRRADRAAVALDRQGLSVARLRHRDWRRCWRCWRAAWWRCSARPSRPRAPTRRSRPRA